MPNTPHDILRNAEQPQPNSLMVLIDEVITSKVRSPLILREGASGTITNKASNVNAKIEIVNGVLTITPSSIIYVNGEVRDASNAYNSVPKRGNALREKTILEPFQVFTLGNDFYLYIVTENQGNHTAILLPIDEYRYNLSKEMSLTPDMLRAYVLSTLEASRKNALVEDMRNPQGLELQVISELANARTRVYEASSPDRLNSFGSIKQTVDIKNITAQLSNLESSLEELTRSVVYNSNTNVATELEQLLKKADSLSIVLENWSGSPFRGDTNKVTQTMANDELHNEAYRMTSGYESLNEPMLELKAAITILKEKLNKFLKIMNTLQYMVSKDKNSQMPGDLQEAIEEYKKALEVVKKSFDNIATKA